MRLIISEKPSVARDIASALGATLRREGFIEGRGDIVTWCFGHLVELSNPDAYDAGLKSWRLETLPIIPDEFKYHPNEKTKEQFKIVKELLNRRDISGVVNAADAGREGELIFDLVYRLAKCHKPVRRLWISSLTREAIIEGFNNLKPASDYDGLRDSAYARQQADWLCGLNATRAQTIVARRAGYEGVYSLGRVQTPTLALLVARDQEIANFVPADYYQVAADFGVDTDSYRGVWFNPSGDRFDKREAADSVVKKVEGNTGVVEQVEKKASRERPPLLYDLTALQRAANARYGLPAAKTLEVAQSLYEKKALTYPRTSSRHLSSDVHKEIAGHVEAAGVGLYEPFVKTVLAKGRLKLTNRHVDDKKVTDHHAVIPTKQKVTLESLSEDERKVFGLVVRRFIGAFYDDAEVERTTVITKVVGETFRTKGTIVLKAGWREVDPPGKEEKKASETEENDEPESVIPPIRSGENVVTLSAETLAKQTKAPPRYTEASLLGSMETAGKKIDDDELRLAMKDSGLGTAATRAAVIETLIGREYVERDKKSLRATHKGQALIEMLRVPILKSAELTGSWEAKLARMTRNEYPKESFMEEVKEMVRKLVSTITQTQMPRSTTPRGQAARPEKAIDCPKCVAEGRDGFLLERKNEKGKFLACSVGREGCGFVTDVPKNAKQRKALVGVRCPSCEGAMRLRLPKEKGKNAFLSCIRYPECRGQRWFDEGGVLQEPKAPDETGPACLKCGKRTVKRMAKSGNYFLACPGWRADKTGCDAAIVWLKERI